jgi:flavin reductase (NADH)
MTISGTTMGISAAVHRDFMSRFPTGVAVVTAIDRGGVPHGLTCNSLTSVTLAPPVFLVCLGARSGTLGAVRDSGRFAVNLLHTKGQHVAEIFSTGVSDRFDRVRWGRSRVIGQPWLLDGVFAWASCVVKGTSVVGDHEVILGEPCEMVYEAEEPLVYGMRRFHAGLAKAPG